MGVVPKAFYAHAISTARYPVPLRANANANAFLWPPTSYPKHSMTTCMNSWTLILGFTRPLPSVAFGKGSGYVGLACWWVGLTIESITHLKPMAGRLGSDSKIALMITLW